MPADPHLDGNATRLLQLLERTSASDDFIFGHHNDNLEGQHFSGTFHFDGPPFGTPLQSDTAEATHGPLAGMTGFNLDWVARGVKLSTRGWKHFIQPLVQQGIILNLFWESANPMTGGTAKDLSGSPITAIMPGGAANEKWVVWMDRIVEWLHDVGIRQAIFRPFHENTGGWFWWGVNSCTAAQYRAAWKYTTGYLRSKGVHSLLYAYSPSKPTMRGKWDPAYGDDPDVSRYPGDDEVDVACFDRYGPGDFSADLTSDCTQVSTFAKAHNKIAAVCETGVRSGIQGEQNPSWYTAAFLEPLLRSCPRLAFVYTWRNGSPSAYWVPLPGQTTYPGFEAFFADKHTIFAGDERLKIHHPSPPLQPPALPPPIGPPSIPPLHAPTPPMPRIESQAASPPSMPMPSSPWSFGSKIQIDASTLGNDLGSTATVGAASGALVLLILIGCRWCTRCVLSASSTNPRGGKIANESQLPVKCTSPGRQKKTSKCGGADGVLAGAKAAACKAVHKRAPAELKQKKRTKSKQVRSAVRYQGLRGAEHDDLSESAELGNKAASKQNHAAQMT